MSKVPNMIHPITEQTTPTGYTRLAHRDVRFASMPGAAVHVRCVVCDMSMHAISPAALVHDGTEEIICVGCANRESQPVRPLGVPHA